MAHHGATSVMASTFSTSCKGPKTQDAFRWRLRQPRYSAFRYSFKMGRKNLPRLEFHSQYPLPERTKVSARRQPSPAATLGTQGWATCGQASSI